MLAGAIRPAQAVAHLNETADSAMYGNVSKARNMAGVYAGAIQKMDSILFKSTRDEATTDRRYVVHCELRADFRFPGLCAGLPKVHRRGQDPLGEAGVGLCTEGDNSIRRSSQ